MELTDASRTRSAGKRAFGILLVVHTISEIGANITLVALPWFVLQLTGSATLTGLSGGALAAAAISAGTFGGVLVDRFGYKRTSVLGDGFSAVAILMVPILYATAGVNFLLALFLIFFARLLDVPVLTARRSMVPEIARRSEMPLERANSLFEGGMHLASLIGPVSAGLLIVLLGPANVFAFAAALVGLATVGTWLFLPSAIVSGEETADTGTPTRFFTDFVEGLRFIRNHQLLLYLLIALGFINLLTFPIVGVILPVYADTVFGSAAQLGIILSIWGFGVLAGTLIYSVIGHRLPRRPLWIGANALVALPVSGLMLELQLVPLIPLVIVTAVAYGPLNPIIVTVRHERIPAPLRGRVFAVYASVALGFAPIGNMIAGAAIDLFGITATLGGIMALLAIYVLVLAIVPVFRQMERSFADPYASPSTSGAPR